MRSTRLVFFLITFMFTLHADDSQGDIDMEQYASIVDFETAPSSIVGNAVNVITGHYVETETDYLSRSASPIHIQRSYSSGSSEMGFLNGFWDLSVWGKISYRRHEYNIYDSKVKDRGDKIVFDGIGKKYHKINKEYLQKGISNTAPPKLAGLVSLKNRWHTISANCPLLYNGLETLFFGKKFDNDHYLLTNVNFQNGCHHYFAYNGEYAFDVKKVQSYDSKKALITEVDIIKHPGKNSRSKIELICDDDRKIAYHLHAYQDKKKYYIVLGQVETNFSPSVIYRYQDDVSKLLTSKSLPDNRYLHVAYEGKKRKHKKVSTLHAPIGVDEQPKLLYKFKYGKRKTHVTDARGNRLTYHWDTQDRLTAIHHYLPDNKKLYRSEEMRWGAYSIDDPSHFQSRHIVDADGYVRAGKRFYNNKCGCVVKEIFYGNLSGKGKLCKHIRDESGEKYIKTYTYYGSHLIKSETLAGEEKDFKQKIDYIYYEGTSLVQMKTISDPDGIKERYFYAYAPCGEVVLEIVDDGASPSIHNLNGVTQRIIKRLKLSSKGLPIEETFSYLDLETGVEKQLSRIVNHYSNRRLIVKKDYYDTEDAYLFSESWRYNDYDLITEEVDRAGRVTVCDYDANGNCIRKSLPNLEYQILYTYDFCNRLIKEEELHDDGRSFVKSYAYDLKGNKIKEVDPYGHETLYAYDSYDRLVEKTLPSVENSSGKFSEGVERYTYNVLNHLSSRKDSEGNVTTIRTNAYGKPYWIQYPDKTVESVFYNKDGSVKTTTDAQGTKTTFTYDYKSRKIKEEKKSRKGDVLSVKEWKYSAFNLLEEIDPEGHVTTYSYNGAGQLTAIRKNHAETFIFYDSLGREKEKWEKCGDHAYRITVLEYDILDQITEEKMIDESGSLLLLKQYDYDAWGNCRREIVDGQIISFTDYNSSSQPERILTPEGFETLFHYDDYINTFGQKVASITEVDPKGNVTFKVFDARGRLVVQERKNTYAETVQKTTFIYNQLDKLLLQKESVIVSGDVLRVHVTAFEYDSRGRETAVIEAKGESEQKITRRSYTAFGEVEEIIKPSGVIVCHAYDALARLSSLEASDGSIHYVYTYDKNNNILEVEDLLLHSRTSRTYDEFGNIISETLVHGYTLEYAYDPLSRLTEVVLPDTSSIGYSYDAGYLREIRRGSYVHKDHYGSHGKRMMSEMDLGLGEIHYDYDQSKRPVLIASQYLKMELAYDSISNVEAVDYTDDLGRKSEYYQYDEMNQLISDNSHQYTFDSLGNRVACDGMDNTHNALNQLLKQGSNLYRYDADGNLIAKNSESYSYDAFGRLIETLKEETRTTYAYDPFHRRLSKTNFILQEGQWNEISSEHYLYQGDKEIGAVDEQGNIKQLRVMGVGVRGDVGAAVLMEFSGRTYVPLHDYRGNVSMLVDPDNAEVVESYRFDAFGVETVSSQFEIPINPWRFSSKRVDLETGWSYFGARYYDAAMGRWTTPDPMWFVNGTNLYCYVRNNPTMYIDPEGLFLDGIVDFLRRTFKSILEALSKNTDLSMDEQGNVRINFQTHPSLDHQSKSTPAKNGLYGPVHVMTVNGIFNAYSESSNFSDRMSELAAGCTSSFVYNATHGIFDLIESFLNLMGIATRPTKLLHKEWDNFFANCPEDGIIIMVCHSQGAILTRNALAHYDEDLRRRIHVVAVAPAAYIDEELCGSVKHYVSKRDFVPRIDVAGRIRNRHTTVDLDPHPDAPFFDHPALSPTYQKEIDERIRWIRDNYGDCR